MAIDENTRNSLDLTFVEGRLPEANDEICISYNMMETIKILYSNVTFTFPSGSILLPAAFSNLIS